MILVKDLGMLVANENLGYKKRYGLYKCDCGKEFKTQMYSVKQGHTKSCGCLQKKVTTQRNRKHGKRNHRLYNVWNNMMTRCYNQNHKDYSYYGLRGIKVCKEWHNIENFINDMYPTFQNGLTLDRKNNDGNYEPSNCRWANIYIQNRNTRVLRSTNKSGYRGVSWSSNCKKWRARCHHHGKEIVIGYFEDAKDAGKAYDKFIDDNNIGGAKNES